MWSFDSKSLTQNTYFTSDYCWPLCWSLCKLNNHRKDLQNYQVEICHLKQNLKNITSVLALIISALWLLWVHQAPIFTLRCGVRRVGKSARQHYTYDHFCRGPIITFEGFWKLSVWLNGVVCLLLIQPLSHLVSNADGNWFTLFSWCFFIICICRWGDGISSWWKSSYSLMECEWPFFQLINTPISVDSLLFIWLFLKRHVSFILMKFTHHFSRWISLINQPEYTMSWVTQTLNP